MLILSILSYDGWQDKKSEKERKKLQHIWAKALQKHAACNLKLLFVKLCKKT